VRRKAKQYPRKKVTISFETVKKRDEFESFLDKTGRKAGPFVTKLVEEAMAKET
jgi:hypothetical protein